MAVKPASSALQCLVDPNCFPKISRSAQCVKRRLDQALTEALIGRYRLSTCHSRASDVFVLKGVRHVLTM